VNHEDAYPEAPTSPPGSMIMVEVNGQLYPMKRVTQCRTCMSPYRQEIEQLVIEGNSYRMIAESIKDRPRAPQQRLPHPGLDSVHTHVMNNHMPIGPTTERALIERRSKEIGRDLMDHGESLVDYVTANEVIIQRGMNRLSSGELKPSMGDLLTAIRNQHAISQAVEGGVDAAAWQEALVAYMEVATQFVPAEFLGAYGEALSRHPVLRALASKALNPGAIDGEVVAESDSE
jgi:hypothetical protein